MAPWDPRTFTIHAASNGDLEVDLIPFMLDVWMFQLLQLFLQCAVSLFLVCFFGSYYPLLQVVSGFPCSGACDFGCKLHFGFDHFIFPSLQVISRPENLGKFAKKVHWRYLSYSHLWCYPEKRHQPWFAGCGKMDETMSCCRRWLLHTC